MEYIDYLKLMYIVVVLLFYFSLILYLVSDYIYTTNLMYSLNIMFTSFLISRSYIYDTIKYCYEKKIYRKIGIQPFDIKFPLVVCGVGIGIFVIMTIIGIKKDKKPDMRKKYVVTEIEGFADKIKEIRKTGVNVVYDFIYGKKHKYKYTYLIFFNATYKEACLYTETLSDKKRDFKKLGKHIIILIIIAIVDFSVIFFRFKNNNYIEVWELVKGLNIF